jgi:outer membrane protein OmpA-like peptidoglycan-associated protein
MKKLYVLLSILLSHFSSLGQEFSIHLLPRFSTGMTLAPSYDLKNGTRFLTPEVLTKYSGTLISTNGTEEAYDFKNNGWGADMMFKLSNPNNGNAWGGIVGFYRQNHIQRASFPTFSFKQYELLESLEIYRQTGLHFGLRREFGFKNNGIFGYFVQMSALYSLKINSKGENDSWIDANSETKNYIENGTGISFVSSDLQPNVLSISPEIGMVLKGKIGLEVSLSYQHTLSPFLKESLTYYQNRKVLGTEETDIAPKSFWLNLRIPINLYNHKKSIPPPVVYKKTQPKAQPIPVPVTPKTQNICVTVRDKNTQKAVGGAKILLNGKVFYTDREGKAQFSDLKIKQKGIFSIQAQNYEGGDIDFETIAQTGCQVLDVELTPIPPPVSIIINGKILKKGENITLNAIQFEQSKSDLLPEGKAELNKVVDLMKKYPTLFIELSGHTSAFKEDTQADYSENMRLSRERAIACKDFIISQLANSESRIKTIGYGPTRPLVPNINDENRKRNRRVELKIESL